MSDVMTNSVSADVLGSAMHFVLTVAAHRARRQPRENTPVGEERETGDLAKLEALWQLAERYHPEQVWLAESCLRGERTFSELERTAPRGTLAPGFLREAGPIFQAEPVGATRALRSGTHVSTPTDLGESRTAGAGLETERHIPTT